MSIAVAAQWIANFLVSWTFPMLDKNQYLTDTFNHGMAYWIYGVMGRQAVGRRFLDRFEAGRRSAEGFLAVLESADGSPVDF